MLLTYFIKRHSVWRFVTKCLSEKKLATGKMFSLVAVCIDEPIKVKLTNVDHSKLVQLSPELYAYNNLTFQSLLNEHQHDKFID